MEEDIRRELLKYLTSFQENFRKELKERKILAQRREEALHKLENLHQTHSVSEYRRQCEEISKWTNGLDEASLICCFLNGLKDEIKSGVESWNPKTITSAIGFALMKEKGVLSMYKPLFFEKVQQEYEKEEKEQPALHLADGEQLEQEEIHQQTLAERQQEDKEEVQEILPALEADFLQVHEDITEEFQQPEADNTQLENTVKIQQFYEEKMQPHAKEKEQDILQKLQKFKEENWQDFESYFLQFPLS